MVTPYQLLQEAGFAQYTAMVRFHYNRENTSLGAEKIAEMVRAIPGATRVSTVSLDKEHGIGIFNVKIISMKPPKEAYSALKRNALERYRGLITGVEVGANTIEVKGDFIIKENLKDLNDSNLGQYIGTLLEEGLLLEVSIEELRRQFVECDPPKLSEEDFNKIVQACNNESNFATWMCKKVASNIINTEDLQLWTEIFEFFKRYKQRFQKKDINQVKTAEDVHDFVNDYNRVRDEVEAKKATGQTQKVKDETDKCLLGKLTTSDGRKWLVYKTVPGQWNLERKIGSGTSWCTVASEHYFKLYMGPEYGNDKAYYIFINTAKPDEKYQIHYGSNQCKDKTDAEVDYATEWVQEFYQYLEKVDGRTKWSKNAIKGKEKLELRKSVAEELTSVPNQLNNFPHEDLEEGSIYKYPEERVRSNVENKEEFLKTAGVFRDLGDSSIEAVKHAEEFLQRYSDKYIIIKPKSGPWDIVSKRSYGELIGSVRDQQSYYAVNDKLPLANDTNIGLYKAAAKVLEGNIQVSVSIRCNPNLPDISEFKVKSEGGKELYKMPAKDYERALKALLQAGVSEYYFSSGKITSDIYAIKENDKYFTFSDRGERYATQQPGIDNGSLDSVNKRIKAYKMAGLDLNHVFNDPVVMRLSQSGGSKELFSKLKSSATEKVDGLSEEYHVGKSKDLCRLIHGDGTNREIYYMFKGEDFDKVLVNNFGGLVQWTPYEAVTSVNYFNTQHIILSSGFSPLAIVKFCQHTGCGMPKPLERILARVKDSEAGTPNVRRVLRLQRGSLRRYDIPYVKNYTGRVEYTEGGNGIYGTWDQLGEAVRQTDPQWYKWVEDQKTNYPNATVDVFIHYNADRSNRDWNGVIRFVQNGQVIAYARRYGNNDRQDWSSQTPVPQERRVNAGHFDGNYNPPQPRQARQPRQAAVQQPAAPAIEITPEVREQLAQLRRQSQNSPEAYAIPAARVQEMLPALGFTNLNPGNRNVVVYKCYDHRGQTTHVALVYGGGQTIVAGYPQNPDLQTAQLDSQQWRRLTHQLDNSVRTFQQCHDICQELRIPLPVAIQGWLVYRGVNNG